MFFCSFTSLSYSGNDVCKSGFNEFLKFHMCSKYKG
jgi:hypothetical protein